MALGCFSDYTESKLVKHMGKCGREALMQEQRQLYSLLSTMLKLGRCYVPGAESFWAERVAGSCCFSIGRAAVEQLQTASSTGEQFHWAAAAQQAAVDYLPSIGIVGRCCLLWAEHIVPMETGETPGTGLE
jgi:hypothetical protein